jgi:hypothetical protein
MDEYGMLVGRKVKNLVNGRVYIVSGIDFEIGITLHVKGKPEWKVCLVNPEIVKGRIKNAWEPSDEKMLPKLIQCYKESFKHWVRGIEVGGFNEDWFIKDDEIDAKYGIEEYTSHFASSSIACPFE